MTAQLDETLNQIKVEMRYSQLTLSTPSTRQTIISNPSGSQCIRRIIFCLALLFATFAVQAQTEIASLSELTETGDFVITDDISASGYSSLATFSGTLTGRAREDGTLPAITGLSVPLFTTATDATISGIMFSDVSVSGSGNVGTVAANANGSTRIFNCGILGGTVGGTAYTGGLVGLLDGEARVINCFSYADITGGSYVGGIVGYNNVSTTSSNIKTMVMNCMFYGDITGGTNKAPIYNGRIITNVGSSGVSNYNYFRLEAPYVQPTGITYNCALGAEDRFLQRFEFFRHLLNGHRELAAWWATGDYTNKAAMAKWVMEPSQLGSATPYPILKAPGKYPSVVNIDAENAPTTTERNKGGNMGTLTVSIQIGSGYPSGAEINVPSLSLNITDKDPDHFNFNYYKVQLPYYNDVGTKNYNGNRVVTGWKIVDITGGTPGSFTTGDDATADANGNITSAPYNFADRNCTNKDLYSISGRVFNQGAYWDVPEGVTSITIEPYWAQAAYLSDAYADVVYNAAMSSATNVSNVGGGQRYSNGSSYSIAGENQAVYTAIGDAAAKLTGSTVYDNAVVLVGNYHHYYGSGSNIGGTKPYTIMSIDLDHDNEPDYSYMLRLDGRCQTHPLRLDFLNVPGLGMAQKATGGTGSYNLGIPQPIGWFEVTNTALFRVTQFEYDRTNRGAAPLILQGGVIEQWVSGQSSGANNQTTYFHVGGNVWFKEFHRGCHQDSQLKSKHPPLSVTGGDYDEFYLTGLYKAVETYDDNAECYINGGRFGTLAGTGLEGIGGATSHTNGNIIWQIQNADIREFYGGGINAASPMQGSITSVIDGGYIEQFCGGPKFGDMRNGKTVTTTATNCTFGTYFGAGYGGNSYSRQAPYNFNSNVINIEWNRWIKGEIRNEADGRFNGYQLDYKNENYNRGIFEGVSVEFNYQFLPLSSNTLNVARLFIEYVKFSLATTRNVTSKLTGCTVTGNFYGGGSLGKVDGPVTSTLTDCTVSGNVFGAGYSATLPTVEADSIGFRVEPYYYSALGTYRKGVKGATTTYTWEHRDVVNSTATAIDKTNHILYTTEDLTTLGTVTGLVTLNIDGTTSVSGSVYGGGESSDATGDVVVNVKAGQATDVYGGGKGETTVVGGDVTVNIGTKTDGTPATYSGTGSVRNVYGGSALGAVNATKGAGGTLSATEGNKTTNVNVYAGTVSGSVFGGGLGQLASGTQGEPGYKAAIAAQNFGKTSITVENTDNTKAQVQTAVYGGANVNGVLRSDAEVTISGGTVGTTREGNTVKDVVFGGGLGQPTLVNGNVTVNVGTKSGDATPVYGGTAMIHGNVYGGSALGNTNAAKNTGEDAETNPLIFYTTGEGKKATAVNLYGGTVAGNVFGGGLGQKAVAGAEAVGTEGDPGYVPAVDAVAGVESFVGGDVTVELYGAVLTEAFTGGGEPLTGQVFGANNWNGTPKGHVLVHVYKTAGNGSTNVRTAADKLASPTAADHTYELLAVYGGGNQAAYVPTDENGHTDVIIDGAGLSSIKYVYGGGNVAAVPATQVTVNGSYEIGDVFGGGNQAGVGGTTLVNVNGGRITDGVYGGCNSSGDVTGDITVNMLGGTPGVAGCPLTNGIFGGGYGQATTTSGNVDVNINGASLVVHGDVYGGSALGQVNSDTDDYTHVTLTAGTLHGDAYGGGLGNAEHAAQVKGNVKVTQNGVDFVKATTTDDKGNEVVTAGRIFGCNNLNGTPLGTVLVLVKKTGSTNPTKGAYQMQAVYGGGNLAAYSPTDPEATGQYAENGHDATKRPLQVVIDGCETASIEYVYGGGNAAPTPSTDVVILGDFEIDLLFGGGNGRDRFTRNGTDWEANPGADVGINAGTSYGTGDANTIIYGGTIHEAYGASNQKGSIRGSINLNVQEDGVCPLNIDKMVGAGRNADIDGDVILVMGCMPDTKTALVFGGADNANVNGNVELTITSGTFGQVFGGNNLGGIIKGHLKVNIEETGCRPIKIDELYLGGNEAAYSVFGYYDSGETDTFDRPIYLPRVSADDANAAIANPAADANHSFPYAQPVLNVISCTSIGKVFGGGLGTGAAMYANPTVNINMIPGKYANLLPEDENNPNRLGAVENVYGGGNEAAVHGNTTVNVGTTIGQEITLASTGATANVLGAYITGTVYGAGKGIASDPDAAIVTGNTQVNLGGGHVLRSIYGGGELGSVGTFTEKWDASQFDSDKKAWHFKDEPKACKEGTGLAEVIITGGQVGLNKQLMPDPTNPTSDDDFGYVFCASKGIADSLTYEKANLLAVVNNTHLEVSGGLIIASVYGGSENGEVLTDTHVEIKGGQIGTGHYKEGEEDRWDGIYEEDAWTAAIAKVKDGTFTDADAAGFHTCASWPFGPEGDRHVYDHYAGTEGYDAKGGASPGSDGHSYFGHVFGGGSGYYPFAAGMWRRTAGRVCGNTKVDITGGHILTNVYGGNEITDVYGHCKVEMTGGTIGVPRTLSDFQSHPVNCYLFGAGMGDPRVLFCGWSNVGSSEVIVKGNAVIFGSVFGGGEDGHVWGNASTTIEGDAVIGTFGSSGVDGNIFGSGRGFSAMALTAGVVCGNVKVEIKGNAKVLGSVFGGGRMAAVGTYLASEDDANYGAMQQGTDHGNVTVNISGGTIGNLTRMNDHEFSTGDVFGGSKGVLLDEWAKSQKLGLVKNTTINISQADAASPTTIYGNVYGGGEIASVGYYKYATAEEAASYNATHTFEERYVGDVYALLDENAGTATINITGGTIGQNSTTDTHGLVFGGCLGRSGKDYSGYSFVNKSFVTLDGGTVYGCVFGGGENGHVFNDTDVEIKSGTVGIPLDKEHIADAALVDNLIYRGNVYGGGRGIDLTPGGDYSITAGKVAGNTVVNVTGGIIYRNVYGGGSLASVGDPNETADGDGNYSTGLATVNITGGQIGTDGAASANDYTSTSTTPIREHRRENGFVFGSGRGMAAGAVGNKKLVDMAYVKNSLVTIGGEAKVTGSVFGGGENGHVRMDTKVYVKENCFIGTELNDAEHEIDDNGRGRLLYRGNAYGGGRGIDHMVDDPSQYSLTAGRVEGDTFIEVSGGKIYHDVFGGGSLASVGKATVDNVTGEVTYEGDTGNSEVHIKGGIIGYSSTNPDKQGFNCGFVYGGCRGLAVAPYDDAVKMAYVHNARVYIEPGADVKGSVFGGGANGHVKGDTYVEITGGSIGTALLSDEVGFDDHGVAVKPVFRGNVYAGGRGVDLYQQEGTDRFSLTAGAVYGNAELKMTGGHVWHNVYGSGAMASVGTVEAKPAGVHVHDEIVDAGGNIINPDGSEVNYLTGVFTKNTGKVTVTITGGTVGDTTPGHEGRNNGRVYGAGRGVSASRSDLVASMEYVNDTHVNIGTSGQQPSDYSGSAPGELNYPYIYGAVFGGGENGHVKTDTHVNIYSGIIGWPLDEGESQQHKTSADGTSKNPRRGHVYGGGRGVDPLYHSSSETRSSTAGRVYGHTYVTMTGGVVRRAIYGGGNLASVGIYRLAQSDLHIVDMIEDEEDSGDATINVSGGIIGNVNPDGTALSGTSTTGLPFLAPGDNNGHVFGSSCGMVADNYIEDGVAIDQQYRQMGYSHSTHVNISGGQLYGSVFGSGENGHVWEDTRINITGGTIGSEESTLIYSGNVYGSGRGVDHPHAHVSETAGKVRGNTTVNVTGGTVWRDVYGGGSLASVGEQNEEPSESKKNITTDPLTNNPFPYSGGLTRVVIDGTAAVHGSVYGSGRGVASTNTEYRQAAYVKNTLVTIKGTAHVYQNVFGGGNAGHVRRNTLVNIDGDSRVDGNVYGGGAGNISSPTAGLVNHDVAVNILGGLVGGDVYGGGAIANTNVHDKRNDPSLYADGTTAKAHASSDGKPEENVVCTTDVNLTGGIILGNAYGGGQGVIPSAGASAAEIANAGALVRGNVKVTLNGTAFRITTTKDDQGNDIAATGRVFGCNNLNGTPQGTVLVHVLRTRGVTESGGTYTVNDTKPEKGTETYEVQAVYGGGNLAAYEPWEETADGQYTANSHVATQRPLQVVVDGCDEASIEYVYGGGNAAATPSTDVLMVGCYEVGYLFGGGNGKDRIYKSETWQANPGADVGYTDGTVSYGTGEAIVEALGGTIGSIFGGSNTKGNVRHSSVAYLDEGGDCPLDIDEVYGGGNEAFMAGNSQVKLGCITRLKALYGGAKAADVGGDIVLTITSGHYDRVFGGNNISGEISGSITVNVEETGCHPITIGELYGCGNQAAYTTHEGKADPVVNVKSFTSIGRIFGGGLGEGAVVKGNPTVNINEVTGLRSTYSPWAYPGTTITYKDGTTVTLPTHESGKIGAIGTVFGGGNAAKVEGNTSVNIGTLENVVFLTPETDSEADRTKAVEGVNILGNVFGGGNEAEVLGKTNVVIGKK